MRANQGMHPAAQKPGGGKPVTISGKPGDDALHYQERAVRLAIEESKR
jgi:hypothetical protein